MLRRDIVGSWQGTLYWEDTTTPISLEFGPDGKLAYEVEGIEEESGTCNDMLGTVGGGDYRVVSASIIHIGIENSTYPECGSAQAWATLQSVALADDRVLSAYADFPGTGAAGSRFFGVIELSQDME